MAGINMPVATNDILAATQSDRSISEADSEQATYLLTWNPEHFQIGDANEFAEGTEHRWACYSQQPQAGDFVYLIRLGQDPRGIVATGTVIEKSHEAAHWQDPSKTTRYIRFRVKGFRASASTGLLPMLLLSLALPGQDWSPQRSGVRIASSVLPSLLKLWEHGENKHSLRQIVDWLSKHDEATQVEWDRWVSGYLETTARLAAIRVDPANPSEELLDEIWRAQNNGVSHVGPGTLSRQDFADNLPFLSGLTRQIVLEPTAGTLAEVEDAWRNEVAAGRLRVLNKAVIRRVFAAADPKRFTSLLRNADCQSALRVLQRQFELQPEDPPGTDWASMNAALVSCMQRGGLDPNEPESNNSALWRIVDHNMNPPSPQPEKQARPPLELPVEPEPRRDTVAPTNLVLYGPPGTGKTYRTIEETLELLAPEMLEGEPDRPSMKAKFDGLVASGRVVFITFHQSFSYEDFVEGLRAETDDNGQIRYQIADGVFKRICHPAPPVELTRTTTERLPFQVGDDINGYKVLRCTPDILELRKPNGKELAFGMRFLNELCTLVTQGSATVEDIRQKEALTKAPDSKLEPYLVHGYANVLPVIVERMLPIIRSEAGTNEHETKDESRVLIIDEINRGNVARIFGELITLIEPSKRQGMPEALSVTLPYSKARFSVPRNLHIIATMNTADRSLVGLDVALRRRFQFRELEPRPDLLDAITIEGVSVGAVLRAMNARIELLLDRDHRLGHAYFLALRDGEPIASLAKIFKANILPLLLEYFFEDTERVRWVLNDHRKPRHLQFVVSSNEDAASILGSDITLSKTTRWITSEEAFQTPGAYAAIVSTQSVEA